MPSTIRRSLGTRDFQGAELRFFRVHMYTTAASMAGDAANSTARIAFAADTKRFYFGTNGAWVGLNVGTLWGDQVSAIVDLPITAPDGEVRVVLDDGSGAGPTLYVYDLTGSAWNKVADPRIVLKDGSVTLTGLLTVASPGTNVPTALGHLTHKKYVDDQDGVVTAAYVAAIAAAINAHLAAADPHPQYTTNAEATVIADTEADAKIAAHLINDPHASIISINAQADARIAIHDASATAHGSVLANFNAHLASSNPHAAAGFAFAANVATDISTAVSTHNTDALAHADIRALITGGGGGGSTSTAADRAVVVGATSSGDHGSPVVRDQVVYNLFHLLTAADRKPDGIIDFASRIVSVTSATLVFSNSDQSVVVANGALFNDDDFFNPGTALNNKYFHVTAIVGNKLYLYPAPAAESVGSTTFNRLTGGARIVLGGNFNIQRARTIQMGVEAVDADQGDGKAAITFDDRFSYFVGLNNIPAGGSSLTLAGLTTPANDGIYTIDRIDQATRKIILTTTLTADQPAAGGKGTTTTTAAASNFASTAANPIDFFADVGDAKKYSQTLGHYRLGRQVSDDQFIVAIEEIGLLRHASTLTANYTETTHHPKKTYFVNTSGGAFTLTLKASPVANDRVFIKDVNGALATNNLTVAGNGQNIDGAASFVMAYARQSLSLVYLGGEWIIE